MEKISIIIVNWNGKECLEKCITSLINQTYLNKEIIMVDNSSEDGSIEFVKSNFKSEVQIVENINNGYAGGANVGINSTNGEYIAIVNPDVVFEKDYFLNCVNYLNRNSKAGAISGKLLKYDFKTNTKKNIIDSVGISVKKNRAAYDIGQNMEDKGQYENAKRVFAVCGAAPVYRREALELIKFQNEYFDEDFFAYKEDIDLCWRLNWIGIESHYIPWAIAYHGRGMNGATGIIKKISNRRNQSNYLKGISFRNQYLMIYKNDCLNTVKKDLIRIGFRFLQYILYFLIFEPGNLKYLKELIRLKNEKFLLKKQHLLDIRKINENTINGLFEK
ncbi:glycosyltransferase family 2 protein [Clostridium sp. 'White wine YQ']|uniref:glycosyltransferase family 2 protein n=1 Tax=Clostridium sp. 'White wine YQ' TaxID=3027474 RepID=UPI00236585C8|nr:glycosyltransferase family 2 protein [Clostridium sp. 'White wine YQ']MDD7792750.1 glycosyltransferase family 2 protein [Clostridium sp. 'White wine YQ']